MRKIAMLCVCLMALASLAGAAKAKKSAAKEAADDSALSPALAEPVAAADQDLKDAAEAVKKGSSKRPAAAIRKLQGIKDDLRDQLGRVRAAKAEDDEAGAKDAAIVAVAAALRAVDLGIQGLQDGDDDKLETARHLGDLASGDLNNLEQNGAQAQAGGGEEYKIGPSFGGDVSLAAQETSTNMSADLNLSFPLSQAMDLGIGGSLNASSSSSGSGKSASSSTGLGYGLNTFARYHLLGLFSRAPWIVPYVGFKIGLNSNESFSTQGLTVSDTTTTSTTLGYSLGTLFFVSAKSAITAQVESTTSSSSSAGSSSPSTGSITLSMGVRQMF